MTSSVTGVEYFMAYVMLIDLSQGTGTEQQAKDGKKNQLQNNPHFKKQIDNFQ